MAYLLAYIALAAHTDLEPAKVRMINWNICAQITQPTTMRAVWVAETSARCSRRIRLRCTCDDLFQRLVYLAFRHGLLPSSVSKWLRSISNCVYCSLWPTQSIQQSILLNMFLPHLLARPRSAA